MRSTMTIGAFLLGVALVASPVAAGEIVSGVLTAVNTASLRIDEQAYIVTNETVYQDKAGGTVAGDELRPGMGVEAEVGARGKLGLVTVDLLR